VCYASLITLECISPKNQISSLSYGFFVQRDCETLCLYGKRYLKCQTKNEIELNKIESFGVLLMGIGIFGGSVATTQSFPEAVLPSVFIFAIGTAVTQIGKYR